MERDLPGPEFRLKKGHLWYLFDLALAVVIFIFVGRLFMERKGAVIRAEKERLKAEAEAGVTAGLQQADSVMAVTLQTLSEMRADSAMQVGEYESKKAALESGFQERQKLGDELEKLSGQIFSMRDRSVEAQQRAQGYEKDVSNRGDEISTLQSNADETGKNLQTTEQERAEAARQLADARQTRSYEPVGMFPDRTGLAVGKLVGGDQELTHFELQHVFAKEAAGDIGVAVGVGLGSGNWSTSKQVGLLYTRQLIHRRLGLDVGAGYSVMVKEAGGNDTGAYASADLRFSPFYKERFHFGVGARAGQGEFLPYVGVMLGRR
jgi:hypothetical protein